MEETVHLDAKKKKESKSLLPILVVLQFLLTLVTLAYVAYFRLYQSPVEYPIVIVKPPSEESYTAKYKGKITVFDLADFSEWSYHNDPEANASARSQVSFIYPPNFDIEVDSNQSIHLIQNNKDFLVISKSNINIDQSNAPANSKLMQFSSDKKFYQYKDSSIDHNTDQDLPLIYQGGINGFGLNIIDTQAFSPEVVYLILMSMDYVE